jgi:hypothetical protein
VSDGIKTHREAARKRAEFDMWALLTCVVMLCGNAVLLLRVLGAAE